MTVRNLKVLHIFLTACTLTLVFTIYLSNPEQESHTNEINRDANYLSNAKRLQELPLLINSTNCKIPDLNEFDEDVWPLIRKALPLEQCIIAHRNWSYVLEENLIMDIDKMALEGYKFSTLSCCISSLTRDISPKRVNSFTADNFVNYSTCVKITKTEIKLESEFNMIECNYYGYNVYRNYHAVALPKGKEAKINYWKTWRNKTQSRQRRKQRQQPPSVIIIGLDSTSRLNFRRNMFKTRKFLEVLGAVEMFGYTKVGENTYPNMLPMLTGQSEESANANCHQNRQNYFDSCPFIFKEFSNSNYITAMIEDAPDYAIFNYRKAGFHKPPTDFYSRPNWIAAHDYGMNWAYANGRIFKALKSDHEECIGPWTNDEFISNCVQSVVQLSQRTVTPLFSFSWSTNIPHSEMNMIQTEDETYFNLLNHLNTTGVLEDSILFFMGDHGYRFGPIRSTLIGYYEDKLPNMWIRLPQRVKQEHPEWAKALEVNRHRLSTPYTVYGTLRRILKEYGHGKAQYDKNWLEDFFTELNPLASCATAKIPSRFCPCDALEPVPLNDSLLTKAIELSLEYVNNLFAGTNCMKLSLGAVTTGAKIDDGELTRYIAGFKTDPGGYSLEIEINYGRNGEFLRNSIGVQRADKIVQDFVKCVKDDANLQLYCYCK